jgi:Sulfotransferase family
MYNMDIYTSFRLGAKAEGEVGAFRFIEVGLKRRWIDGSWNMSMLVAAWREPTAVEFYNTIKKEAYQPDHLLRVAPRCGAIYLMVPKAASRRIRTTLGAIDGRRSRRLKPSQWGRVREVQGPRSMTFRHFYRLAMNPMTFRFSFVRNPYERLLSCWAHIFRGKPLVSGPSVFGSEDINWYLARREVVDKTMPAGPDKTLSFEQFVIFATASANSRHNPHFQLQDDLLSVPGIALDFVGRVETFNTDFAKVLDHLGASEKIRREALVPLNKTQHGRCSDHYTPSLADRVYQAYERDFVRFGYPRALPD